VLTSYWSRKWSEMPTSVTETRSGRSLVPSLLLMVVSSIPPSLWDRYLCHFVAIIDALIRYACHFDNNNSGALATQCYRRLKFPMAVLPSFFPRLRIASRHRYCDISQTICSIRFGVRVCILVFWSKILYPDLVRV